MEGGNAGSAGAVNSTAQCAAYMGLVPVPVQSRKIERVALSKAGNRKLKAKLYMVTISFVKDSKPDTSLVIGGDLQASL